MISTRRRATRSSSSSPRPPDANLPAGVDPLSATGWAPRPSSAPPVVDDGALGQADGLENSVLALLAAQLQAERQRAAAAEAKLSKALESTQAMAVRSAIAETKLEAALASNAALEAANAALQK
ncbi:hypothetical protein EMIHUDRAFT_440539 [Emiliania huxleyi CCMP1516]|uniref:Uncharacterized protein n=2 Tax=Emiliania huxleyi TaxID=2903 RepID=A0A0D3KL42_EMIH1|nr:hypothetical protein EMIHUDRAFT_440539 [Emiliania huxleyi CCMP1516]EOD36477.1 hypothetical protein EMIHUDRAFT_440539 [Emiliania huxleyi CCMP1516]|eukprot:XP_005788906.1 hypothetical protein EMIHUDRAFT_440539 [Emiliania huxleyi CCMP1516]